MKSFFKKYKKIIIIVVIVLIIIGVILGLFSLVAPDYRKSLYGNRLESIKEHKIDSKKITNIKKDVKELDFVSSVDYNLKGKIMNFVIVVAKDTKLTESKKIGNNILDKLDKNEKDNYDIQVFLISDEKNDNYPVIGYKHKTSDELVWTK